MSSDPGPSRRVIFTRHARDRMAERGASEQDVLAALRAGEREPAQRGLAQYRLNVEFRREWDGRYYGVQQLVAVVDESAEETVVVTVYTFYFQEGRAR